MMDDSSHKRSENKVDVIELAKNEFAKGTIYWPKPLINSLEKSNRFKSFCVVKKFYYSYALKYNNVVAQEHIENLNTSIINNVEPQRLREKSNEIWYDKRCHSFLVRGVTRLFNALASFAEQDFRNYEMELMRAVWMLAASEDSEINSQAFNEFVRLFQMEDHDETSCTRKKY